MNEYDTLFELNRKHGLAMAVKSLVEASDKLKEALSGAQFAKDESLFNKIYEKQMEISSMANSLIK